MVLQAKREASSASAVARLLFLIAFLVYAALLPTVMRRWEPTGDEPHYLAITQSLVQDSDLDLSNNYAGGPETPHVVLAADGSWWPAHGLGLPLLLALPYALGGLYGAYLTLALLSALLGINVYHLALELGGDYKLALLAWGIAAFLPPTLLYTFLIYPELPGALILVWSLRQVARIKISTWRWAGVGLCAAYLPWLVLRFAPMSAFVIAAALVAIYRGRAEMRARLRQAVALVAPALVSGALYLAYTRMIYGSFSPLAMYPTVDSLAPASRLGDIVRALLGWLLDQRVGLLCFAPIYGLAYLGLLFQWNRRTWGARLVVLAILWHFAVTLAPGGFWIQWSPPTRYFVFVTPLLAVGVAFALTLVKVRVFALVAILLALVSATNAAFVLAWHSLGYAESYNRSPVYTNYSRKLPLDLTDYLPLFDVEWVLKLNEHIVGQPEQLLLQGAGLDVIRGETIADPSAIGGRAVQITPQEAGSGDWLITTRRLAVQRGLYHLRMRAKSGADPGSVPGLAKPVLRLVVSSEGDGEPLFQRAYSVAELGSNGEYLSFNETFLNPHDQLLTFRVQYLGVVPVTLDHVAFWPETTWWAGWGLALLWSALIGAVTLYGLWARDRARRPEAMPDPIWARLSQRGGLVSLVVGLAIVLVVGRLEARPGYYQAEDIPRSIGQVRFDASSSWFRAVTMRTTQGPGALSYGPYEFFEPGKYVVSFRLKTGATPAPNEPICGLEVAGYLSSPPLIERVLYGKDFGSTGHYQTLELPLDLKQTRRLTFRVQHYAVYDVTLDEIVIWQSPDVSAP